MDLVTSEEVMMSLSVDQQTRFSVASDVDNYTIGQQMSVCLPEGVKIISHQQSGGERPLTIGLLAAGLVMCRHIFIHV